jgi:hypothetical protein
MQSIYIGERPNDKGTGLLPLSDINTTSFCEACGVERWQMILIWHRLHIVAIGSDASVYLLVPSHTKEHKCSFSVM